MRSIKICIAEQRDLWVRITHRINKVYITMWHKIVWNHMQQQFYQLSKLWNVCTFVKMNNSKFRRENPFWFKNEKIWDLEFILIRNKIFILRRSEAVSRDSCQLAIRWHIHDNAGWIEIKQLKLSLVIYFYINLSSFCLRDVKCWSNIIYAWVVQRLCQI